MVDVKLELETLSSHQLYVIVTEAVGILKDRSNIKEMLRETGKVISPDLSVIPSLEEKRTKSKTKKKGKTNRRGDNLKKDFSKIDKFLKENFGKMSVNELAKAAWEKEGIRTDEKQIYYRKRVLGLRNKWKINPAAVNRDPLDAIPREIEMEE